MVYQTQQTFFGRMLSPGVRFLLIVTSVAFLLQLVMNTLIGPVFTLVFSLSMNGLKQLAIWQPVTYLFMHAGFWHIFLNMLALFFFGPETERFIGTKRFLYLYFLSGIAGGLGWLLITPNEQAYCIGASGAVFGVLGAFAALFPKRPVTLFLFFVLPITMRARTLAIALGLLNLISLIGPGGQIAYAAHLAGGLVGYGYAYFYVRRSFPLIWLNPQHWLNQARWHWQRRRFKVISGAKNASTKWDKHIQSKEIDRVLEKISKHGIQSLTKEEHEILEKGSYQSW